MSDQPPAGNLAEPTAEVIAHLLDVVAAHSARDGLGDIEQIIARLRQDAEEASAACTVLRRTSADVLRDALRLRSSRRGPLRDEAHPSYDSERVTSSEVAR